MCLWLCWWPMNKLRRLGAFAVSPLWSLDISWCVLYDCVKYFHYTRRVTSKQLVMSKVSVCLSLFRFTVVIITALACTETRIIIFFKQVIFFIFFKAGEVLQKNPCSGSNADAEIKVPLLRTQSCERFRLKPGVGQNTALHTSPAAWNFLLVLISTLLVHSSTLLFSTACILNCISCG